MATSVSVDYIDDGTMIKVTVKEDGFVEFGMVSSQHLVDTKVNQLRAAIKNRAIAAWDDPLT